jgi:hypothetical protein
VILPQSCFCMLLATFDSDENDQNMNDDFDQKNESVDD